MNTPSPLPAPSGHWSRRRALKSLAAGAALAAATPTRSLARSPDLRLKLARFSADVTVPAGHGMMGGAWLSKSVADPLEAHGIVLMQGDLRVVFVSVDWCEIRNQAYEKWQTELARAADTLPERVMITTVHQHDAPVADLEAERILRARGLSGTVCDPAFHDLALSRVVGAIRLALREAQPVTHLATGQARVERIASNRRYVTPDGQVRFDRMSSTRNAFAIQADEGLIDPQLKHLGFWNGSTPIASLSFYAVHPMSYYGQGEVSADFPGLARRRRAAETRGVQQIYCSGCSGNVTAGKYNDGARPNRAALADRLHAAMAAAARGARRAPVSHLDFRFEPVTLEPRMDPEFTTEGLEKRLSPSQKPFQQCLAAMGLSWRRRFEDGKPIQLPVIDFGPACVLLLPGESYVEFQLAAQRLRPDDFVCVAGYGDGATGYIPTAKHIEEHDPNLSDWCWVAPGAEERLLQGMRAVLKPGPKRGATPARPGT